jgi:hypothetical protein
MPESTLYNLIALAATRLGHRIRRQNAGTGWQGADMYRASKREVVTLNPGDIVLRAARPLHAGAKGLLDLVGWTMIDGRPVYTEIEVKTAIGRIRPEQSQRIEMLGSHGVITGVVRSEEEYVEMVRRG